MTSYHADLTCVTVIKKIGTVFYRKVKKLFTGIVKQCVTYIIDSIRW